MLLMRIFLKKHLNKKLFCLQTNGWKRKNFSALECDVVNFSEPETPKQNFSRPENIKVSKSGREPFGDNSSIDDMSIDGCDEAALMEIDCCFTFKTNDPLPQSKCAHITSEHTNSRCHFFKLQTCHQPSGHQLRASSNSCL
jgi:hypothetical protein